MKTFITDSYEEIVALYHGAGKIKVPLSCDRVCHDVTGICLRIRERARLLLSSSFLLGLIDCFLYVLVLLFIFPCLFTLPPPHSSLSAFSFYCFFFSGFILSCISFNVFISSYVTYYVLIPLPLLLILKHWII